MARSQVALTTCSSSVVCPTQSDAFMRSLEAGDERADTMYVALEERLSRFYHQSNKVRKAAAAAPPSPASNRIVE